MSKKWEAVHDGRASFQPNGDGPSEPAAVNGEPAKESRLR